MFAQLHFSTPIRAAIVGALFFAGPVAPIAFAQSMLEGERGSAPIDGGSLMLRGKGVAETLPAMRLGTDIKARISGTTARVTVTQAFRNGSAQWMEATYLYPLPQDGAVDSLNIVAGDRILVGAIKPREEARAIFDTAAADGRKAGLIEQVRPNMFRSNVANVGPGETVLVQFEFQAPIRQLGDEYALRLPLVVGPRYIPGSQRATGDGLRDAMRVTAPIASRKISQGLYPVSITVELAPGFAPSEIVSPYHPVTIDGAGLSRTVTLAQGETPANRDFELRWRSAGEEPQLGLFKQEFNGLTYVMATVTPPSAPAQDDIPPREMVFVIDNSGSMGGESMRAARSSLLYALDTLRPQDRFNIIRFDDSMTQLFEEAVPASERQLAIARRFTQRLDAQGGTDMLPALRAALKDRRAQETDTVRQIIFLTDGSLSNEEEMLAEIAQKRGRSRVFMVGIGSAPNNFLMDRLAREGRGTFANIGMGVEVAPKMRRLLDQLSAPIAQNLTVSVDGETIEFSPSDLPDLYAGEPLVLIGRSKQVSGTMTVSGKIAGELWSRSIDLSQALPSDAVAKLWAHRRISEVEAQRWSRELDSELAARIIKDAGMTFGLVTSETSLIAEDATPSRPAGAMLAQEELPLLLPHGWDFDTLFNNPETAEDRAAGPADGEQDIAVDLPQTAALFSRSLLAGMLLLLVGAVGLTLIRRRQDAQGARP